MSYNVFGEWWDVIPYSTSAYRVTSFRACWIVWWKWRASILLDQVRGEIITTVLCCIVYWSCAQS